MTLDKYVGSESNTPLVVVGEEGSGKSALLSNWAHAYAGHHPEDLVVTHFAGCTPASSDVTGTLERLMLEMQFLTGVFTCVGSCRLGGVGL